MNPPLNLTPQITLAQIAFALMVIAFLLAIYIFEIKLPQKYSKKRN